MRYSLSTGLVHEKAGSSVQREDLSRNFGFILHDVARLLRATYDRRMKALGLTRSQWWVLTYVYREQGLTQSALAEHLEVGKVALGNLIDRLLYGFVLDFFEIRGFPVFNLADACITLGAGLIILHVLIGGDRDRARRQVDRV